MKYIAAVLAFFIISAYFFPLSVYLIYNNSDRHNNENKAAENEISVFFHEEDKVKKIGMEEYLTGVVAAEMPASFETEALKAQAVAARSYAVYKMSHESKEHPDAAVCTDYKHCKAYKSGEKARSDWGKDADVFENKIQDAVMSTKGEILTYNGEACLTVFHSQSGGGRTENSADVWGGDYPYLVSVESYGEESAPNFYSSADIPFTEFAKKINEYNPLAKITKPSDIGVTVTSEGGGVKSIYLGGQSFKGTQIRSIFGLRSSCFEITADDKNVHFEVSGYGHGVGMSQYGANSMAKDGKNYKEILTHYYSGTVVEGV